MSKVDVVEVARTFMLARERYLMRGLSECSLSYPVDYPKMAAMARVVLAAAERVKRGHNDTCLGPTLTPPCPCTCGHAALVKALKGYDDKT